MNSHEIVISTWLEQASKQADVEAFGELHINRIDPNWRGRSFWLQEGLHALQMARTILNGRPAAVTLALTFSLKGSRRKLGSNFKSAKDLELQFDQSPPALCLFTTGHEPWKSSTDSAWTHVRIASLPDMPEGIGECFYLEFKHPAVDGYSRTLLVLPA